MDPDELVDHIVSISTKEGKTILNLDDGTQMPIQGINSKPFKLNIKTCSFCGLPSDAPLFTTDKKHFICKNCVVEAAETLMEHGVELEFHNWKKLFGGDDN